MQKTVRVLIADDSQEDRALFRHILKTFDDFEVVGLTINGAETIAYLNGVTPYDNRNLYAEPDLVLLDFQMPPFSGLDVLGALRHHPRGRKIVLWSDAPDLIHEPSAYRLGASVVCAKPLIRSDLVNILTRAFMAPGPKLSSRHAPEFAGKAVVTQPAKSL